ncbi:hypothetical protein EWM64_g9277 [Hericium alpestre]|uniref:Kinase n=1 Tax=Hericium alpestre TaxID=135208 RepID=A0A4Y9ZJG9_9AGAM|nr:hypothetical protein EWM64_g9277 [Hericium alpestre]
MPNASPHRASLRLHPSPVYDAHFLQPSSNLVSAAAPTAYTPWSSEDEYESAWESEGSAYTPTSSTSASSPLPLSPAYGLAEPVLSWPTDEDERFGEMARGKEEEGEVLMPVLGETEAAEEDEFPSVTGPDVTLPHIPLRPFRNQVGGHTSIYKFTKRAVCKPLVSRENLFYEAVEREAPPLLDFIPRYLGVMLVSYRRVSKAFTAESSPKPSDASNRARPPLHKAVTHAGITISAPSLSGPLHNRHKPPASAPPELHDGDTDIAEDEAEAELPEVVLDRNRHIVPEWMLRSAHRSRALSTSYASLGRTASLPRSLRRNVLGGTASSPDLGTPFIGHARGKSVASVSTSPSPSLSPGV